VTILSQLDMSQTLGKDDYDADLKRYQAKLNQLAAHRPRAQGLNHSGL
jgi:hypothetical protein